jgi:predicted nucleic acid-binding protein
MNFSAIASGAAVFIDANVFVYSFAADATHGDSCTELLERVELGDLQGFLSASVFAEIAHRLMTLEACDTFAWPYAGIASRLRRHPADIQKLTKFRTAIAEIEAAGFQILPVTRELVVQATSLSLQHGLLTNDALIVAAMQSHGLTQLASNDSDFDRVPGILRFAPD